MSDIEFRPEFESVVNVANKNYTDLQNKPSINGNELEGDKSSSDLGIATKVSELENDENFQENVIETISVNDTPLVPEEKAVNINVPVNVSELENDAEYITDDDVPVKSISVNSTPVEPDEDGNVNIEVDEPEVPVKSISVNSTPVSPDGEGNVDISVPDGLPTPDDKNKDNGNVMFIDNTKKWVKGKFNYSSYTDILEDSYDTNIGTLSLNNTVIATISVSRTKEPLRNGYIYIDSEKIVFNNSEYDFESLVRECYGNFTYDGFVFSQYYYDEDSGEDVYIDYGDPLYDFISEETPFKVKLVWDESGGGNRWLVMEAIMPTHSGIKKATVVIDSYTYYPSIHYKIETLSYD